MIKIKLIIAIFLALAIFSFFKPPTTSAVVVIDQFYSSSTAADSANSTYQQCPVAQCTNQTPCYNNATPGSSNSCGISCDGGNSWSKYDLYKCYQTDQFGLQCTAAFVYTTLACSTADKYNIPDYGGGDATMLRAGSCACQANEIYKTCCSGTTAVGTYNAGGNPSFPDGGCQYTTVPCGTDPSIYSALGYTYTPVSCGTPACQQWLGTPTPSPTATPQVRYYCSNGACVVDPTGTSLITDPTCGGTCSSSCPTYAPPATTTQGTCPAGTTCIAQQPSQTVTIGCTPNSQCTINCAFTCVDSVGNKCPATTCNTVWACQGGTQWYNGGQYYYTCPASCPACVPGSTQTVCGTSQNQCHIPGT